MSAADGNGKYGGGPHQPIRPRVHRCPVRILALVAALFAFAAALLPLAGAGAAIRFKRTGDATLGGPDALADQKEACEYGSGHLWVSIEGRGDCVAYYPTSALTAGRQMPERAIIYFEGDIPNSYRRDPAKLKSHLASMQRALEMLAATYKVPYVMIARPGTFGSTGNHANRRKDREYLVMNAAVDRLKSKYGLRHLSLAGQSGGATIAAALLTLGRADVRCAAPASGGYDLAAMLDWHAEKMGQGAGHREHPATLADDFNVMDRVAGIQRDADRRIFVIGDVADKVTPFAQQRRFAERLREAGHRVELIEAQGAGPDRHGLTVVSLKIAGLCASGAPDTDIRRLVQP